MNVKVVGRKELNHFHLEQGVRQYPEDYPETLSFKTYLEEEIKVGFLKYLKTPLPKRPNYLQLNSPHPFGPRIPEKPLSVELNIVSRGRWMKFAYICELSSSDLEKVIDKMDSGYVGIVASEEGQG